MRNPILQRWDERLRNWALWYAGSMSQGVGCAVDGVFGEGAPRPPPPLIGEAVDTNTLVQELPAQHRQAVEAYFAWGGSLKANAAELGVDPEVLTDRVDAAEWRLEDMHQKRRRAMVKPPAISAAMK